MHGRHEGSGCTGRFSQLVGAVACSPPDVRLKTGGSRHSPRPRRDRRYSPIGSPCFVRSVYQTSIPPLGKARRVPAGRENRLSRVRSHPRESARAPYRSCSLRARRKARHSGCQSLFTAIPTGLCAMNEEAGGVRQKKDASKAPLFDSSWLEGRTPTPAFRYASSEACRLSSSQQRQGFEDSRNPSSTKACHEPRGQPSRPTPNSVCYLRRLVFFGPRPLLPVASSSSEITSFSRWM